MLGDIFIKFWNITGKLSYEVTYSISHFSNQALIGPIVPKTKIIQEIFKNIKNDKFYKFYEKINIWRKRN